MVAFTGNRLLVDHQSSAGPLVQQVRGSLLVSSLETLRAQRLFDRYLAALPREHHEPVLFTLAASWVPVDLALAHYQACDDMALSEQELGNVGSDVGKRIMGTFLGTLVRTAQVGSSDQRPLYALQNYHRLWDRILLGGGCRVTQSGPKDALIESRGIPMLRYRYFREAYVGLIHGVGGLFRRSMYAKVKRYRDMDITVELSWV